MIATSARRSTAFLLFAAFQFVALTALAMQLYPGYRLADHFLSDLGATRTWAGERNDAAAVIFAIAVAILGAAMIGFAGAWRDYAYGKRRAAVLGHVSQICGTLSGVGFVGVAFTPIDQALDAHNLLVVIAYGLLLAFATSMTFLWWRNGAPAGAIVAGILYFVLLVTFFASAGWAIATDLRANIRVLIVGQKIAAAASMAYVTYVTLLIRRQTSGAAYGPAVANTRR